jgi:hypothetical protein
VIIIAMALSEQQLHRYATDGYLVLPQFFSAAAVAALAADCDAANPRPFLGFSDGEPLHRLATPFSSAQHASPKLNSVVTQLYPGGVLGLHCGSARYAGNTRWHPDHEPDPAVDAVGIVLSAYLGELTATTGALRVLPGGPILADAPPPPELLFRVNSCATDFCCALRGDPTGRDTRWGARRRGGLFLCCLLYSVDAMQNCEGSLSRDQFRGSNTHVTC